MGCVSPCGGIELPIETLAAGEHTVSIEYRGTTHQFIYDAEYPGEAITIPQEFVNDGYEHLVSVTDPDGEDLVYVDADVEYDCIRFKTNIVTMAQSISVKGNHYTPNE